MSAVGLFLQNPIGFMDSNIVILGFEAWGNNHVVPADGVEELTIQPVPANVATGGKHGKPMNVYRILPGAAGGRTFRSYWCPYQREDTLGTTVSNGADFMFTATMDGCSFGIGQAGADGSRLVYHSNLGGYGRPGTDSQAQAQATTLKMMFGASLDKLWEPKDYRIEYGQSTLSATTWGLRNRTTGSWSFFSHIYEFVPGPPARIYFRQMKDVL